MIEFKRMSVRFVGESDAYDAHRRALNTLPRSFHEHDDRDADVLVVDAASSDWSAAVLSSAASMVVVSNPWSAVSDELATTASVCVSKGVSLLPDASGLIDIGRHREVLLQGTKSDPILSVDVWLEQTVGSQGIWLGSLIAQELALLKSIGIDPTGFGQATVTKSGVVLLASLKATVVTLSGVALVGGISRFELVLLNSSSRRYFASPLSGPVSPSRLELDNFAEQRRNRPVYSSGTRLFWLELANPVTAGAPHSYALPGWLADLRSAEQCIPR